MKDLNELNIEIEKELQDAIDAQLFQASTGIDSGNNISRKAIEEARRGVFQDDPYQYQGKAIVGLDAAMCIESCLPKALTSSLLLDVFNEVITDNFDKLSLTTVCK